MSPAEVHVWDTQNEYWKLTSLQSLRVWQWNFNRTHSESTKYIMLFIGYIKLCKEVIKINRSYLLTLGRSCCCYCSRTRYTAVFKGVVREAVAPTVSRRTSDEGILHSETRAQITRPPPPSPPSPKCPLREGKEFLSRI